MTRIYLTPSEPPKVVFFPAADPFVDLVFTEGATDLRVTYRTLAELTAALADATLQADRLQAEQSAKEEHQERDHRVPCRNCQRPTLEFTAVCVVCQHERHEDAMAPRRVGLGQAT